MCKEARQPLPIFSDDEVVNYLVTEAIIFKEWREQEKAHKEQVKQQKREAWKSRPVGSGL